MLDFFIQIHKQFFFFLHSIAGKNTSLDRLFVFLGNTIDIYVVILSFLVFVFFVYKSIEYRSEKRFIFLFKEMIRIIVAVCVSWGLTFLIKKITALPRPFLKYSYEVTQLINYGGYDTFPSGHATLFMALGIMMSLHHRRIGYVFIILAIIIGFMRIVIGIHFPIDVLVGWCIGGSVSFFVYTKLRRKIFIKST